MKKNTLYALLFILVVIAIGIYFLNNKQVVNVTDQTPPQTVESTNNQADEVKQYSFENVTFKSNYSVRQMNATEYSIGDEDTLTIVNTPVDTTYWYKVSPETFGENTYDVYISGEGAPAKLFVLHINGTYVTYQKMDDEAARLNKPLIDLASVRIN